MIGQEKYRIYVSSLLNPSGESGEEFRKLYNKVAEASLITAMIP